MGMGMMQLLKMGSASGSRHARTLEQGAELRHCKVALANLQCYPVVVLCLQHTAVLPDSAVPTGTGSFHPGARHARLL